VAIVKFRECDELVTVADLADSTIQPAIEVMP